MLTELMRVNISSAIKTVLITNEREVELLELKRDRPDKVHIPLHGKPLVHRASTARQTL